jgi:hypothetical protein
VGVVFGWGSLPLPLPLPFKRLVSFCRCRVVSLPWSLPVWGIPPDPSSIPNGLSLSPILLPFGHLTLFCPNMKKSGDTP